MNTIDYKEKIKNRLDNQTAYKKKIKTTIPNKNNNLVINLIDNNYTNRKTGRELKICNAQAPRIYCLPKLYKQNIPSKTHYI